MPTYRFEVGILDADAVLDMSRFDMIFADAFCVEVGLKCVKEGGFWLLYPQVWQGVELGDS